MNRNYCKAYRLENLRQFSNWVEKNEGNELELSDDDIVYLWDDFTVSRNVVLPNISTIFDTVSFEWQEFCKTVLKFEIPEDLRFAYSN